MLFIKLSNIFAEENKEVVSDYDLYEMGLFCLRMLFQFG